MSKRNLPTIFLFSFIGLHLLLFNTAPSFATAGKPPESNVAYCSIWVRENPNIANPNPKILISIDFIFIAEERNKLKDAKYLIDEIGTQEFTNKYLKNGKIYFYDNNSKTREIYDVKFIKKDKHSDYIGFRATGKLQKAEEIADKISTRNRHFYLGCNIKNNSMLNMEYLSDTSNYINKDKELLNNYSKAISKIISEAKSKMHYLKNYPIERDKDEGWLVDLDDNGVKELIVAPSINFKSDHVHFFIGSLAIFYKDGHYKTRINFGQPEQYHLFFTKVMGVIDYDLNGEKELVVRCHGWEDTYYLLISETKMDSNIIFPNHLRRPE